MEGGGMYSIVAAYVIDFLCVYRRQRWKMKWKFDGVKESLEEGLLQVLVKYFPTYFALLPPTFVSLLTFLVFAAVVYTLSSAARFASSLVWRCWLPCSLLMRLIR